MIFIIMFIIIGYSVIAHFLDYKLGYWLALLCLFTYVVVLIVATLVLDL